MRMACDNKAICRQLKVGLHDACAWPRPSSGLLSFSVRVTPLDMIDWLSAQPFFPKVYWQGRNDSEAYGGVGAAVRLNDAMDAGALWSAIERLTADDPDVMLLGGMRFDAARTCGEAWRPFGDRQFVLPRFMIVQRGSETTIRVNVVTDVAQPTTTLVRAVERDIDALCFEVPHVEGHTHARVDVHEVPAGAEWKSSVKAITGSIEANELNKVVLARRMDLTFPEQPNPFVFIRDFMAMKSPAYFFCLQLDAQHAFVGSSPERLYRRDGRQVMSEALAGTRRRGTTAHEDAELMNALLSSSKERYEHKLVADHIRHALGALCESVNPAVQPHVLSLILVQHLYSTCGGTLRRGVSDQALVQALHPTPAVGGVPTENACAMIHELEPFDRGWYAAPFGLISRDRVDLTVAIRSGLLHGRTLSLYSGAGIVGESDPDAEWNETEIKFANFLRVIHVE